MSHTGVSYYLNVIASLISVNDVEYKSEGLTSTWFFLHFFFKQKTAYEIEYGLVGSEMCIRDRTRSTERQDAHRRRDEGHAKDRDRHRRLRSDPPALSLIHI